MIIGDIETTEKVEYEDLLKNYYEKMKIIEEQDKEIERLENIIKEVREYITSQKLHKIQDTTGALTYQEIKLLEILDGENE